MPDRTGETIDLGGGQGLTAHALRDAVVNELHARPFHLIETPRRVVHLAFMTDEGKGDAAMDAVARLCRARGVTAPAPGARHHRVVIGNAGLRIERHTEFTTLTLDRPADPSDLFARDRLAGFGLADFAPEPGPLMVAVELALVPPEIADGLRGKLFEPADIRVSAVDGGAGVIATDFRQDASGFTRFVVADEGLGAARAGALVQRLLEVETYRTLALLGLPAARLVSPELGAIEKGLSEVTREMTQTGSLEENRILLDRIADLAARLEAQSARTSYRFGAARAYYEIVGDRLDAIGETPIAGGTLRDFLTRRMAPAMRTCQATEDRQQDLSTKLARAANLLRTRVDIDLESQNRDLLRSMNERTRLQLRLQQTVEGLSIAAVSYYVVGLAAYLFKGGKELGFHVAPELATALAVPVVVLAIALFVRRLRASADD